MPEPTFCCAWAAAQPVTIDQAATVLRAHRVGAVLSPTWLKALRSRNALDHLREYNADHERTTTTRHPDRRFRVIEHEVDVLGAQIVRLDTRLRRLELADRRRAA